MHGNPIRNAVRAKDQDVHLDALARSIGRQHHISTQINGELETHSVGNVILAPSPDVHVSATFDIAWYIIYVASCRGLQCHQISTVIDCSEYCSLHFNFCSLVYWRSRSLRY
jgi:hypothetical protein